MHSGVFIWLDTYSKLSWPRKNSNCECFIEVGKMSASRSWGGTNEKSTKNNIYLKQILYTKYYISYHKLISSTTRFGIRWCHLQEDQSLLSFQKPLMWNHHTDVFRRYYSKDIISLKMLSMDAETHRRKIYYIIMHTM